MLRTHSQPLWPPPCACHSAIQTSIALPGGSRCAQTMSRRTIGEHSAILLIDLAQSCARFHSPVPQMDEGRKGVLLIAASILAARKLAQYDGGTRVPATIMAIGDVVRRAEQIMRAIDERWPVARSVSEPK